MPRDNDKLVRSVEDLISSLLAEHIEAATKSLKERIEAGIKEVARTSLIYREVWRDEAEYKCDEIVTHEGGVWLALADSKSVRPGTDKSWRLIVKRGERGFAPSIKIDVDGLLTAHYPDGTTNEVGSIKELVRNLLIEHGAIPNGGGQ
jgi:hypothetical protein